MSMLKEKPSSKIELSGILYTDMEFIEVSDKEEDLMAKLHDKKRVRNHLETRIYIRGKKMRETAKSI